MHIRPHKIDREATKAAKFLSRYSYISLRVHPGAEHQCTYAAGADCESIRERIFRRDKGHCQYQDCQAFVSWEVAEMDHIEGKRKVVRCWCDENLRIVCGRCHRRKHNREAQMRGRL